MILTNNYCNFIPQNRGNYVKPRKPLN